MSEMAVVNASPIIYLARTKFLHLLHLTAPEVLIPRAVAAEIEARGPSDPAVRALADTPWLRQIETPRIPDEVLAWDLGPGESAVIAWALAHPGCLAVIDDLEGRRCSETLGIRLRGTLGLVLRARQQNMIKEARPVLETLRAAGMYLSHKVIETALAEIGESVQD
jgi:predicted nucleic acid-binding protein